MNTQMHPLPLALLSVLHVGQTFSEGVHSIPGLTVPRDQLWAMGTVDRTDLKESMEDI